MSSALPPGPYLVVGLARAGRAAAAALADVVGPDRVVAWEANRCAPTEAASRELDARGVRTVIGSGERLLEAPPAPRCLVKSPGVPAGAPILVAARERGLPVIDELEVGWRLARAPVLAVTGTNGKSTTVMLIAGALRRAGSEVVVAGNTDFDPPLSAVASRAPDWFVCEVSSYQLEGCAELLPDVALLTNLTHDHLHRHGTMEAYAECKRRLFVRGERAVARAVVPADDDFGLAIGREIELRGGRVLRFGRSQDADYRVLACDWSRDTAEVELATPDGALSVVTPLPGNHNALNVAAAFAACEALGVDRETAADAFREAEPVAGRWDVQDEGQPFDAIVDYAHNPDGVVRVLEAARRLADARGSSVRTVIAAGGGNDASKRPAMGYQARHLSDQVIVTSGNSRGEAVSIVADGVMSGAERADGGALESVLDRRGAIRRALECAEPGDVVLVLGRGAMPRLLASTSGDGRPFDDRAVLREELHRLRQNAKAHPVGSA